MNKRWLVVVGAVGLILAGAVWWEWPDDNLKVVVCDVGQGDSILIQRSFSQIIVDGGPGSRVLGCLGHFLPFFDHKIEVVVLTHPQADHMEGLIDVFERFEVETLVADAIGNEGAIFERLKRAVGNEEDLKVHVPEVGDKIKVGGVELEILWPARRVGRAGWWLDKVSEDYQNISEYDMINDLNEVSVVVRVKYGEFDALLTGDMGESQERQVVQRGQLSQIEVLKVAHHGSKYSSSREFLEKVRPEVAVISSGKNSFGHPTRETLTKLEEIGAEVLRTDEKGDVVIGSDGKSYWVE